MDCRGGFGSGREWVDDDRGGSGPECRNGKILGGVLVRSFSASATATGGSS